MNRAERIASHPAESLPQSEFAARTGKLPRILRDLKLDVLFVHSEINRFYFTGLVTSNGAILAERDDEPLFFTDFRYMTAAKRQIKSMVSKELWRVADQKNVLREFGCGWKRVGYEGSISASQYVQLCEALPDAELVDISKEIGKLRSIKSAAERKVMRRACAVNDAMLDSVLSQVEFGMTEWEISALIRRAADVLGQGESFDAIVCAGRNGAECHHHPDMTALRKNKPLLIDLGVKVDHYCSDMTRTNVFGTPDQFHKDIFRIVVDANRKAISKIKPGVTCEKIDKVARDYIKKAGYGRYFDHGLGHGLGLEVHEGPNFTPGDKTVLKPGMVLTVEPGIYLPGRFGVRVEDVIIVTKEGCEIISASDRSGFRNV